ncbi:MAG: helix-turn-helix domain-containing protein [Armatimonadetes bacterium]|nr:helix-turn-helix domain-containing protein [Anaerolineae bacterium]
MRCAQGEHFSTIARDLGVSYDTVRQIYHRYSASQTPSFLG